MKFNMIQHTEETLIDNEWQAIEDLFEGKSSVRKFAEFHDLQVRLQPQLEALSSLEGEKWERMAEELGY
jgi:hypothetical protein